MSSPKMSLENHTIRVHPKVWEWAEQRAREAGYDGISQLFTGLVVYDYALRRPHWLTRELGNDPARLEEIISELENHPLEETTSWLEHRLRELFHPPKPET